MRFNNRLQPFGIETVDGREALGNDFTMAAVRTEDLIARSKRHRAADRGRFLADRQVRRPLVAVFDTAVGAGRFEGMQHALELADHKHVTECCAKSLVAPARPFHLQIGGIGVNRNIRKPNAVGGVGLARVDLKLFRQGL